MGDLKEKFKKYMMRNHQYEFFRYTKDFKAPDWRQYKVEDAPELLRVQQALAQQGLKNPWLRNEVWRYNPAFGNSHTNLRRSLLRGSKLGIACGLLIYFLEINFYPDKTVHVDHH